MYIPHVQQDLEEGKIYEYGHEWSVQLQGKNYIFQRYDDSKTTDNLEFSFVVDTSEDLRTAIDMFLVAAEKNLLEKIENLTRQRDNILWTLEDVRNS